MWIDTGDLSPDADLSANHAYWIYNGLDSCITFEVWQKQQPLLEKYPEAALIYKFERAMQAPALDMMLRGFKVDMELRQEMIQTLDSERTLYESRLNALGEAVWGRPLNARSPKQLMEFFENWLKIDIPVKRFRGEETKSLDRKALEKLRTYFYAKPFVNYILEIRDRTKSLGTLRSGVDSDGRIRTSYNVASTETGRWSSSENAFGTGTNLQNITERLRRILVADPGYKLAYIDLEQAESRIVAILVYECLLRMEAWCVAFGLEIPELCFAKALYLEACESGDLHTSVAMMTWPELEWTDDLKTNKAIADDASRPFYRDFTFRDIAKRLGHGTNYRGSPFGMSQIIAVEAAIIDAFQKKYLKAFPIEAWHKDVIQKVQALGEITTPLGRRRQFFGRRNDDSTIREAIAYQPQSMVGDLLNLGLWRVYNHYRRDSRVQLLAQVHDAIVVQYRELGSEFERETIANIQSLIEVPLTVADRTMTIPSDVKVGWNFAKSDKKLFADGNPDGLIGYKGNDNRRRQKALSVLDRVIR